jgi:exodeoxyribonuclease-3
MSTGGRPIQTSLPLGPRPVPRTDGRFAVTTWNVNGVRARADEVAAFVECRRPDVLCLQEIKASPDKVPAALRELPGYWSAWHGHKGYSGVGLLLSRARFPDPPTFTHPAFDHETRIVVGQAGPLRVASTYVHNGNKDFPPKVAFLHALRAWASEGVAAGESVLLCGDLNVAREPRDVHPMLRNPRQIGQTPGEQQLLEEILRAGLHDLLRSFASDDDRLFTWWAPWRQMRERNIGWRLDYVLADAALAKRASSCRAERLYGTSDHAPVTAVFDGLRYGGAGQA